MDVNGKSIRQLLRNINEPLVFKNILNWNILNWSLDNWCSKLCESELKFRLGKFKKTSEPQWETKTEIVTGTFKDFLQFENESEWLYFDYKYLRDWLENVDELKKDIQWGQFGFDDITYKDCTIWIGNKGAHTPCHIDTYGFNLVAQIYGKKHWLLFPPNENLLPTRLPYEESSIYSRINFFSPNRRHLEGISMCKSIILNPGEVLFVPQGWWHYVENLEIAISINTWIPLESDANRRVEEAIVKILMDIMNENPTSTSSNIDLLNSSISYVKETKPSSSCGNSVTCYDVNEYLEANAQSIRKIPTLIKDEFKKLFEKKIVQSINEEKEEHVTDIAQNYTFKKLIESITHPDVIALIKSKMLEESHV